MSTDNQISYFVSDELEALHAVMDIGAAMISCGADVHSVEVMVSKLGHVYGAEQMEVLALTEELIVTGTLADGSEHTWTRRILEDGGADFRKLEALSKLVNDSLKDPKSPSELQGELDKIKKTKMPLWYLFVGGICSTGGFALFFGGGIGEGLIAAVYSILICLAIRYFKPLTPNTIVFNLFVSLIVGVLICAGVGAVKTIDLNMIIIGDIMLLIPGVAMTNATRDMLSGDTISGAMRFIESLLWATALAIGFMGALWMASWFGWTYHVTSNESWPLWAMIIITAVSSFGFALFFDIRTAHVPIATIGGILTWLVYYECSGWLGGIFIPCLIASTFGAIWSEILGAKFRVPSAIFFIIAVIPLVPGRGLYYTMSSAVGGDMAACGEFASQTLMFAGGIAMGILLVASVVQTFRLIRKRYIQVKRSRQGQSSS